MGKSISGSRRKKPRKVCVSNHDILYPRELVGFREEKYDVSRVGMALPNDTHAIGRALSTLTVVGIRL